MMRTVVEVCSGEAERKESKTLAHNIMHENGYTAVPRKIRKMDTVYTDRSCSDKIPLCLPFISDKVSFAVRQCLVEAGLKDDVVLVDIPNNNIKHRLVRNRLYDKHCVMQDCVICPYGNMSDCTKVGLDYQIECMICQVTYFG